MCVNEVKKQLPKLIPITLKHPDEIVHTGGGWGAYEEKFRKISNLFSFPETTLGDEQADWLELIETGSVSDGDETVPPVSFNVDDATGKLLEQAAKNGKAGWKLFYYLGVYYYAKGRLAEAESAWIDSVKARENAWALRNLAVLNFKEFSNGEKAREQIERGFALGGKNCRGFLYDYAAILTQTNRCEEYMKTFPEIAPALRENGRVRLFLAIALMNSGDLDAAAKIVNNDFRMNDVREGELSISEVWFELYGKIVSRDYNLTESEARKRAETLYPLPKHLDFRMD